MSALSDGSARYSYYAWGVSIRRIRILQMFFFSFSNEVQVNTSRKLLRGHIRVQHDRYWRPVVKQSTDPDRKCLRERFQLTPISRGNSGLWGDWEVGLYFNRTLKVHFTFRVSLCWLLFFFSSPFFSCMYFSSSVLSSSLCRGWWTLDIAKEAEGGFVTEPRLVSIKPSLT